MILESQEKREMKKRINDRKVEMTNDVGTCVYNAFHVYMHVWTIRKFLKVYQFAGELKLFRYTIYTTPGVLCSPTLR